MADPERPASDRVDRGAVRGGVVGQDALDGDSVPGEELDGSPEERDDGERLVVGEYLGVGQAGAVIDRDVNVFPPGVWRRFPAASSRVRREPRFAMPVMRAPAPRSIRPSRLTSMWMSSPGRARS